MQLQANDAVKKRHHTFALQSDQLLLWNARGQAVSLPSDHDALGFLRPQRLRLVLWEAETIYMCAAFARGGEKRKKDRNYREGTFYAILRFSCRPYSLHRQQTLPDTSLGWDIRERSFSVRFGFRNSSKCGDQTFAVVAACHQFVPSTSLDG